MTIKVTAITASAFAALLYVLATIFPNDIYFYVISSNIAVDIGRVLLSGLLVYLAFRGSFKTAYASLACTAAAILLTLFGLIGIFDSSITYSLFRWFKPLDYVFMIEAGVIFGLIAATYEHGTSRLPRLSRPRNIQLKLFSPALASMFGFETNRQGS